MKFRPVSNDLLDYKKAFFLRKLKLIILMGQWDGRFELYSLESDKVVETQNIHIKPVTAIQTDEKEQFLITGMQNLRQSFLGSKNGQVCIWKIDNLRMPLRLVGHLHDHKRKITSIDISSDMKMFTTSSLDGSIHLYDLFKLHYQRSYYSTNL
jgi:WD40 repeat protein